MSRMIRYRKDTVKPIIAIIAKLQIREQLIELQAQSPKICKMIKVKESGQTTINFDNEELTE